MFNFAVANNWIKSIKAPIPIQNQWNSSLKVHAESDKVRQKAENIGIMQDAAERAGVKLDLTAGQEKTLNTYDQMAANLKSVEDTRQHALRQYNTDTAIGQRNGQLLGGGGGFLLQSFGGVANAFNKLDSDAAFVGNAVAGSVGTLAGMLGGFSGKNEQLDIQRRLDKAVQDKFMRQTVKSGNRALEGVNRNSDILGGNLTDQSIANTNNYYAQEAMIQDSGIEGSGNMSRNMRYGQGRNDAAMQGQYDMITDQALGVGRSMADSFDQLVQNQEQNTLSTLINPVQFNQAAAMQASNDLWMRQPTVQDYDNAITSAIPNLEMPEFDSGAMVQQQANTLPETKEQLTPYLDEITEEGLTEKEKEEIRIKKEKERSGK